MTVVDDTWPEFDRLFLAEHAAVARSVYLIVHDVARSEDITQDAFVQLLRHWAKVSRYERPGAWVRRVAIRLAVQASRRERLRSLLERGARPPQATGPADIDLMDAVRMLSAMQRAAVVLFYFENHPVAEISQMLGCSEPTARVHLHRARRRLAELLGEEVPTDAP